MSVPPRRGTAERLEGGYLMGILELSGVFGLILLALDIWALLHIVQSSDSSGSKVIWVLLILFLPLLGFLLWLAFGPRKAG
jgi:Phospholipase_D-nuclease N-terminal